MSCGIDTILAERRITGMYSTNALYDLMRQQAQQVQQQYPHLLGMFPPQYIPPQTPKKKEEKKMLGKIKEYVDEHKNIIFTLGLIILVDHFLFKGALKERIKTSIEGVLKKVEDKFHKEA